MFPSDKTIDLAKAFDPPILSAMSLIKSAG